ncbi:MAG: D-alanine--D-alanine ligase [Firmicutes bacterium]|nr:D-alanine--D-alanine ligase [Bacillota bacterium]
MIGKVRVGLIFGGRSGEHEVSLMSAASVFKFIDRDRFEVVPIGISKQGKWVLAGDAIRMLQRGVVENDDGVSVALVPEPNRNSLVRVDGAPFEAAGSIDVVFPMLHGTYGEDGTIQGLLDLADIPYVGSGVLASAAGMDKDVMKRLFREKGLPVVKHRVLMRHEFEADPEAVVRSLLESFRPPLFVKPANLGSSVGVTKVKHAADLEEALGKACQYDRKVLVEEGVENAREIECAVLGNDDPVASPPGEIVPSREFYDYTAKYLDPDTQLIVPADLPDAVVKGIQRISIEAFRCIDAAGLARVDFFVERDSNRIWLNEINTLPGFTSVSMYPKMIQATGISYTELVTRLIDLAIERHADRSRRVTTYRP